jgi:hypothetical protein
MTTKIFNNTTIFQPILSRIIMGVLILGMIGCDKKDSDKESEKEPISFIKFSVSGSKMNGDFEILQLDLMNDLSKAIGVLLPAQGDAPETATITYMDLDQGLQVAIIFPAEQNTFEIKLLDENGIGIYDLNNNILLDANNIELDVTNFKKTGDGILASMSATGNFEGTMIHIDVDTNQEYIHQVSGNFKLN